MCAMCVQVPMETLNILEMELGCCESTDVGFGNQVLCQSSEGS